jgi:anti-sigma factor RsiW
MIETMESRQHATDGDLVRLLDSETTAADADLAGHVAECQECGARLARFRLRSERVAAELRATDVPSVDAARLRPPFDQASVARRRRRRWAAALWSRPELRAAAALILIASVAAASPAARGWILDRVARLRGATPAPRSEPRPSEQGTGGTVGARVWFEAPTGEELVVRFDAQPAGGTLALGVTDDDRASAQVIARARGEGFLVLPGELRVRNTGTSVADYRITLPPGVRRVRVHVGPAETGPILVDVAPGATRVILLGELRERR